MEDETAVMSSPQIGALSKAMAKAQAKFRHAGRKQENPEYRSRYADLEAVIDAIRPALSENGLWVTQRTDMTDNAVIVETILHHDSGEWLNMGRVVLRPMKDGPQAVGSAQTYAQRYGLKAAFVIAASGDDDDAEAAEGRTGTTGPEAAPKAPDPKPAEGVRQAMADEPPAEAAKPKLDPAKVREVLERTPRRAGGATLRKNTGALLAVLVDDAARLRTLVGAFKAQKIQGPCPESLEAFELLNDPTTALLYAAVRDRLARFSAYEEKPDSDDSGAAYAAGGAKTKGKAQESAKGAGAPPAAKAEAEASALADDAISSFLRES